MSTKRAKSNTYSYPVSIHMFVYNIFPLCVVCLCLCIQYNSWSRCIGLPKSLQSDWTIAWSYFTDTNLYNWVCSIIIIVLPDLQKNNFAMIPLYHKYDIILWHGIMRSAGVAVTD